MTWLAIEIVRWLQTYYDAAAQQHATRAGSNPGRFIRDGATQECILPLYFMGPSSTDGATYFVV